jgi:hypothetical protein
MTEEEVLKRLAEIRGNINELQKYHSDEWIMREVLASMALSKDAPMTLTDIPRPWSTDEMKRIPYEVYKDFEQGTPFTDEV